MYQTEEVKALASIYENDIVTYQDNCLRDIWVA